MAERVISNKDFIGLSAQIEIQVISWRHQAIEPGIYAQDIDSLDRGQGPYRLVIIPDLSSSESQE